jgi:hypothetical protein
LGCRRGRRLTRPHRLDHSQDVIARDPAAAAGPVDLFRVQAVLA